MDTETLYLRDGESRIDMVLAYEEDEDEEEEKDDVHNLTKKEKRRNFEMNLRRQGLILELEPAKRSLDKTTNFVKISARLHTLQKYAEILNLKMPIKKFTSISYGRSGDETEEDADESYSSCFSKLSSYFDYDLNLIPPEPNFFTAGFVMDREDKFIVKDRDEFLSDAQRSMVVWQILLRTKYDDANSERVGVLRLLSNGVYNSAYPIHDGRYKMTEDLIGKQQMSDRQVLYAEWAQPSKWYKKQPLWLIKKYFGDKIGLYFAWLGFYTVMLIPAALVGLVVFAYGLITMNSDTNFPSKEICNKSSMGNVLMCPQCDRDCDFWRLHDSCTLSKFTYIFDNGGTVFFAAFMSFWATMFLEFWKREQSVISWEWDLTNFEEDEQARPEYETQVKTTRINPVTKKPEAYLHPGSRAARLVFSSTFVLLMLCIVIMSIIGVMVYRIAVSAVLYSSKTAPNNVNLFVSLTSALINLIVILILNNIYKHIALWLTNLERPRTQTDFENSYTFKMFLFQCINFYSSLVYIAFFKGKFFTHPGDRTSRKNTFTEFANDVCDPAGCFYELVIQLFIIMVGKQFLNSFIELIIPKIITWWKRYVYRSAVDEEDQKLKLSTRWELDYALTDVERLAFLDEYLEMVIQYGFVTLFVAAFPLAPLFALINNVAEIRLDAYKYVTTMTRPVAERAQDIGVWAEILQTITYISVVTNGITIAIGSDLIPHLVYEYGYSNDSTLAGYVNFSLTAFNVADWGNPNTSTWANSTYLGPDNLDGNKTCYFKAFRESIGPDYLLSEAWFHILAAKGAFVLVFEHFIFGLTGLMALFIPDVPTLVKIQMSRERLLEREILFELQEKLEDNDELLDPEGEHMAYLAGLDSEDDEQDGSHGSNKKKKKGTKNNDTMMYLEDS